MHSDYTYSVNQPEEGERGIVLSIIDEDKGETSVTNNIRAVVMDVCMAEGLVATDCLVVYRDSRGVWDGWDTNGKRFYYIGVKEEAEAVRAARLICQIEKALDMDTWEEI